MDLGGLKGPAEHLASRVKAFKKCLQLATECLTNKDYPNAEMIYAGVLTDLHKDCIVEALNLNELQIFSLHSCYAYASVGVDSKSEQALVILNSILKPIELPLVPYLKAFVHISNDRISFANDELECCESLLKNGYNFKPNDMLNEQIVAELNEDFLKLKVNGLRFICNLVIDEDSKDLKKCFRENWMKIGTLCEPDFAKVTKSIKTLTEIPPAKVKNQAETTKKTQKKTQKQKTESIAIQVTPPKGVNVCVQTMEKDNDKQLLAAVLEIKNKMNNLINKKDNEIKQLQKKNNELNEKLLAKDNNQQKKSSEFDFIKDQYLALEKKLEHSQKQNELLQKLLVEQLQQKYRIQYSIYQLFEEKCSYKANFLSDLYKFLHPMDKPTPEECKQEAYFWKNTYNKMVLAKKSFEMYFRTVDDLIVAKDYSSVKTSDWPEVPNIPTDAQDVIYKNFKCLILYNKAMQNAAYPSHYSSMLNQYGNLKGNVHNPKHFVNSYNTNNQDGRTTGSPPRKITPPAIAQNQKKIVTNEGPRDAQNRTINRNGTSTPPSPMGEPSNSYQSEQELLKFLQSTFEGVDEVTLLEALYQVRDINGGNLMACPKKLLVNEIKKALKKDKGGKCWNNISQVQWHNDHSESKCCICFEEYDHTNSHMLTCQHEFHKKCITSWLKRQSACPVCRVHAVVDEEFPPLKP